MTDVAVIGVGMAGARLRPAVDHNLTVGARFPRPDDVVNSIENCCKWQLLGNALCSTLPNLNRIGLLLI